MVAIARCTSPMTVMAWALASFVTAHSYSDLPAQAIEHAQMLISSTIASLPVRAGKDPNKPQDFDLEAPLARLLGPPPYSPNPNTTPSQLWAHSIASYLITDRFGSHATQLIPRQATLQLCCWPDRYWLPARHANVFVHAPAEVIAFFKEALMLSHYSWFCRFIASSYHVERLLYYW